MIYLTLVALLVAADDSPRKQSAIAPSLPALTKEEEAAIEKVVERLILADTGRLRGEEENRIVRSAQGLDDVRGGMQPSCSFARVGERTNEVEKRVRMMHATWMRHRCPDLENTASMGGHEAFSSQK